MHGAELDRPGGGDCPGGAGERGGGHGAGCGGEPARRVLGRPVLPSRRRPSVVYGVGAHHMGGADEHATVEDLQAVFAVHTFAVFDYLLR